MSKLQELEDNLKYYQEVYVRATKERRFRTAEGAQWNIDRTQDAMSLATKQIRELKK